MMRKMGQMEKRIAALEQRVRVHHGSVASLWGENWPRWPNLKKSNDDYRREVLKETAGALKTKLPKDLLSLQKKMRREWNRKA